MCVFLSDLCANSGGLSPRQPPLHYINMLREVTTLPARRNLRDASGHSIIREEHLKRNIKQSSSTWLRKMVLLRQFIFCWVFRLLLTWRKKKTFLLRIVLRLKSNLDGRKVELCAVFLLRLSKLKAPANYLLSYFIIGFDKVRDRINLSFARMLACHEVALGKKHRQ